jgi:membrane protease YdiL (CAAX protease family)
LGFHLVFDWRSYLEPPLSLCGCEFDAAVTHRGMLALAVSWGVVLIAALAGILLILRRRLGLLALLVWFLFVAALPWMEKIAQLPYQAELSAPIVLPRDLAWTVVCVVLGLGCLFLYFANARAALRLTIGPSDRGAASSVSQGEGRRSG